MNCSKCDREVLSFSNSFHKLCKICNSKRLEAKKPTKVNTLSRSNKKPRREKLNRLNRKVSEGIKPKKSKKIKIGKNFAQDEKFYEECFHSSNHKCEECNKQLPTEFRDDEDRVIARFRYSHIVAKSIAPELRHNIDNINHLCHTCHFQWDHGDKKSMKIYEKNRLKFPQYL